MILGFSAGAVLGVALFELIPESFDLATGSYSMQQISLFIAVGFIIYMTFDRLFSLHVHGEEHCENSAHNKGQLGAMTLSLHSFLDGFGIGLAFKVSPAIGWVVAAAVLAHDFSDGINTVNMVLKNRGKVKAALKWLLIDAVAPAIGVAATFFFHVNATILGLILAVFTGFFLYLGASDLIPESHHRHPVIWTTLMTVLGIAVIYGATLLAG
jgi:ZIP family zinc transporter